MVKNLVQNSLNYDYFIIYGNLHKIGANYYSKFPVAHISCKKTLLDGRVGGRMEGWKDGWR